MKSIQARPTPCNFFSVIAAERRFLDFCLDMQRKHQINVTSPSKLNLSKAEFKIGQRLSDELQMAKAGWEEWKRLHAGDIQ